MKTRRCIFIVGTRAQLVKVAPVLREAVAENLPHTVWFTGQHRESIDDLIADFELRSQFIMPDKHEERSSITSLLLWMPRMVRDCRRYLQDQGMLVAASPLAVVHGDTLSTLLGAIAAKLAGAEVVHLESGLSSNAALDPFPEEILRRLTFRLTRYALCPNAEATARMQQVSRCDVIDTGENTLLDSVRYALRVGYSAYQDRPGTYFVASLHRFQNIYPEARLTVLVEELLGVATIGKVYFVLHPPTERRLRETGLMERLSDAPNLILTPRLPYTRFVALIANARGAFSDGGSNQEELSYLGVPTVLFRERSERPDGLGRNIALRAELDLPLVDFILSGGLDRMRYGVEVDDRVRPSRDAVKSLRRWATIDGEGPDGNGRP